MGIKSLRDRESNTIIMPGPLDGAITGAKNKREFPKVYIKKRLKDVGAGLAVLSIIRTSNALIWQLTGGAVCRSIAV